MNETPSTETKSQRRWKHKMGNEAIDKKNKQEQVRKRTQRNCLINSQPECKQRIVDIRKWKSNLKYFQE